ncbi:DUF2304 domain-containing protein [Candidatus Uhrbacteria bacterium]|nr:DUF2304 domain-containing protein [Candidatus Uhrbacteria bacterium]
MTIQILVTLFSVLVIGKALSKFQKKEVHGKTILVWSLFWIAVIFLIWQPNLTDYLAAFLQVTRGADAVFYLSIVVIFYLLFRMVAKLEKIDGEITTLVREIALLKKNNDT